ncbi:MAG: NAD-dependent epimerase/dehydratase family protein [Candidatus Wallbacteria bacterium]|nr:NAD-dependent epimerase/dehydratase family protein [Candidatus Wallbacteria bacterium]
MKLRVVVTGGAGFIGSAVVRALLARDHTVRVVDNLSKHGSTEGLGCELVTADLRDPSEARSAFEGFDHCVNMAARIGGIGYFHRLPATILAENNQIYSATFEAAAELRYKRMLYISSSMVFESATRFPSAESDLTTIPMPVSAYGFSKLSGEWYCKAYRQEHGLPYTIVRPFNAYGVNEYPGEEVGYAHVIPDLVAKFLDAGGGEIEMLGDGSQTRCFTHVEDIAAGIVCALESERGVDEDFNISHPREISMLELAGELYRLLYDKGEPQLRHVAGFANDVQRRIPDVAKARRVLGFEAKIGLDAGLPPVVEWLKRNHKGGASSR